MILKYNDFIKEGNTPVFVFDAPNFAPKTVAQSLTRTHSDPNLNLPHKEPDTGIENSMMYSELENEWYSYSDIEELQIKYDIWCKQNGEVCDISIVDTDSLDSVLELIS